MLINKYEEEDFIIEEADLSKWKWFDWIFRFEIYGEQNFIL